MTDDGATLLDSSLIVDYLDHLVAPERACCPIPPMLGCARSCRSASRWRPPKTVQVVYEQALRPADKQHAPWLERVLSQIEGAYGARAARRGRERLVRRRAPAAVRRDGRGRMALHAVHGGRLPGARADRSGPLSGTGRAFGAGGSAAGVRRNTARLGVAAACGGARAAARRPLSLVRQGAVDCSRRLTSDFAFALFIRTRLVPRIHSIE